MECCTSLLFQTIDPLSSAPISSPESNVVFLDGIYASKRNVTAD